MRGHKGICGAHGDLDLVVILAEGPAQRVRPLVAQLLEPWQRLRAAALTLAEPRQ